MNIINIFENGWIPLPEIKTLSDLEQHLSELDPYTFDILYKDIVIKTVMILIEFLKEENINYISMMQKN